MDYLNKTFRKNPDIVTRKIDDEFILVPISKSVEDVNSIYVLNEVSSRIWELIDGEKSVKDAKEELIKEYEVSSEKLEKDIIDIVKELEKTNCISEPSHDH